MDFERLSSNLIVVINEVLKNQKLVNLIGHNGDNYSLPLNDVNPALIAPNGKSERILAFPFDVDYKADVRTQLHVYIPRLEFVNNANASKIALTFDIVVHKNLWMMKDEGKKLIRPYQIAKEIMTSFKGKSIPELGTVHFHAIDHLMINSEFQGVRILCQLTEF